MADEFRTHDPHIISHTLVPSRLSQNTLALKAVVKLPLKSWYSTECPTNKYLSFLIFVTLTSLRQVLFLVKRVAVFLTEWQNEDHVHPTWTVGKPVSMNHFEVANFDSSQYTRLAKVWHSRCFNLSLAKAGQSNST